MDITFKCPSCEQELEVDSSGAGSTIECPSCSQSITVPVPESAEPARAEEAVAAAPPAAQGKAEKHFVVPVNSAAAAILIQKPAVRALEAIAKEGDKTLRIKTFRRNECMEGGKDQFDDMVSAFLEKTGHMNVVSLHPVNYSRTDASSSGSMMDYGVMVVFKG